MASQIELQDHNNRFLMREIVPDIETTGFERPSHRRDWRRLGGAAFGALFTILLFHVMTGGSSE
jgi:hypothetical protein